MPNRILRDGILTSHRIHKLDDSAMLFYYKLISAVDDFGRYLGSPTALRVAAFPLRVDNYTDDQIANWIAQCEKAGLIEKYCVELVYYIEIKEFGQRMRLGARSKFPAPPRDGGDLAASAPQDAANAPRISADPPQVNYFPPRDGGDFANFSGSRAQAPASASASEDFIKESGSEISNTADLDEMESLLGLFIALGRGLTIGDRTTCTNEWLALEQGQRISAYRFAMQQAPEWRTRETKMIPQPWNYLRERHWERAAPRVLQRTKPATRSEEAHERAANAFREGS